VYTQYLLPISPMQCFYGPVGAWGERCGCTGWRCYRTVRLLKNVKLK